MGYRDAPPRQRSITVIHGPFPIGLVQVGVAAGALAIVGLTSALALDDARLDCDRAADLCTYRSSAVLPRSDRFRLSEVRRVDVNVELGSKNQRYGVPFLELTNGQLQLKKTTPEQAQRFARALKRELASGHPTFRLDLGADRGLAIPASAFLLVALLALYSALQRAGRVAMVVDERVLRLTRSFFGLPVSSGDLDLDGADVEDVEVEWERRKALWSYSPGRTHGRLMLVRGAAREPLTPVSFPGYHLHLRAAAALRDALGLGPRSRAHEEAQAARARTFLPQPIASGVVTTLLLAWFGITVGSIAGLTLALAGIAALGASQPFLMPVVAVATIAGAALGIAAGLAHRRASTR